MGRWFLREGHCDGLLTHDRDFLDDAKSPEHRNSGAAVPQVMRAINKLMVTGITTALGVFPCRGAYMVDLTVARPLSVKPWPRLQPASAVSRERTSDLGTR